MALINCPECSLMASDRAFACPHCGFPFDTKSKSPAARRQKKKRRRLPNGFGRITEITNANLSKPYRAMITTGKDQFGRPIGKILGYFQTYNNAYEALVEYNRNPYDLSTDITISQLYDKWTDVYFEDVQSPGARRTITSAWLYCSSIYNMKARELRARHIKGCMDEGYRIEVRGSKKGEKVFATAGTKARIKSMFNLMLDYGLEYEIVDKNYARTFDISGDIIREREDAKRSHIAFTDDEISKLWDNLDVPFSDMILIQLYSGWRPQELVLLEIQNVDLENWTFTGGMKTTAGTNRIVPIHSKVQSLVERNYKKALELKSDFLFNAKGQTHAGIWKMSYDKYANRFKKVVEQLQLNSAHRPHDPRKGFVTMAKKYSMDEYAIKYIVGHQIEDITERVYTEREIKWLSDEIEKIK